jgi:hypothetical protein
MEAEFMQLGKSLVADSWGIVYAFGEKSWGRFLGQSLCSLGKVVRQIPRAAFMQLGKSLGEEFLLK